jgi:predicted signal transduction protein with EAL and GGDEF domain
VLCAHLVTVLDRPVCIDGYEIGSSLTIGASVYPSDGADADSLAAKAETALYRAKADQRGSTRFFEPAMGRQIREKRALQHDIGAALAKNELELHFQPQALPNGRIFGFEALLRWRHPVRGLVPPGLFIPLAEEIGAIGPIDEWVLREACREAASWRRPLSIAVNLSPVDFRRGDVAATILATLVETASIRNVLKSKSPRVCCSRISNGACHPAPDQGSRRAHRDGRFRHRLFIAVLPAGDA